MNSTSQPISGLHACSGEWGLGAQTGLGGLPRDRSRLATVKIIWMGLYDIAQGVQGKVYAYQRGKRSLPWECSNSVGSQNAGPCLHKCHRWDELATVCNSRSRKASMSVKGGGQQTSTVLTPGVAATTKLWAGTGHCLHLPGEQPCSAKGSTTWGKLPWGSAWPTSECGGIPQVSDAPGAPHTPQLCLPYPSFSPAQLYKWSLINCYFYPLHVWAGNIFQSPNVGLQVEVG